MAGPSRPPFFLIPAHPVVDQNIFHIQDSKPPPPPPQRSNRGRKPSKAPAPPRKKQLKRGMGMVELERQRMAAEIYKTQINQLQSTDQFNHLVNNNNGGIMLGSENNTSLGPYRMNPYVYGASDTRVNRVASNEPSSSSSSMLMPKMTHQYYYDPTPCVSCCSSKIKKKKFISEMSPSSSISTGLPDLQGLNLENNNNFEFNDQMGLLGGRASRSAFYSNQNNINLSSGGAEVVAVHRKINPKSGRNIMMEYEFFPDGKKGTFFNEITTFHQNPSSDPSSNSVDLSLKLSF